MKRNILIGFIAGVLIFLTFLGVGYASGAFKLEVNVPHFNWSVDGKVYKADPHNWTYHNGKVNVPSTLIYEGTAYIPIRLAAETIGYEVKWDAATSTALLTAPVREPIVIEKEVIVEKEVIKEVPVEKIVYVEIPAKPEWEMKADAIITTGEALIGKTTYQFGAPRYYSSNFDPTIFDCSSFTQYIYYQHGIKISGSSRTQAQNGVEVGIDELRKGDLVFTWTNRTGEGNIGHVAIYIGDNKLLHTWGDPGVKITDFKGSYWEKRFVTARRVIQ